MQNFKKQSGFTLVEIAIVLVIIGLLLGGILKGQELINSARVRNLADQSSATQAAYYGFIDRYRQVPGDWVAAQATIGIGQAIVSPSAAGDGAPGNGRIDEGSYDEASGVWEQLSKAGFISGNYVGGAADADDYRDGTRAPVNAFNGSVVLTRLDNTDYQGVGGMRLSYFFGGQVPAPIMRELDVKLDDGVPDTGILRAVVDGGADNLDVIDVTSATDCVIAAAAPDPAAWDIATGSQDCGGIALY